jgi:hypothetical protein
MPSKKIHASAAAATAVFVVANAIAADPTPTAPTRR